MLRRYLILSGGKRERSYIYYLLSSPLKTTMIMKQEQESSGSDILNYAN